MAILEENQLTSLKVLGFLYLRLGAFERARRLFRALAGLFPEDVETARNLAFAELEAGSPERALECIAAPPLAPLASDPVLLLIRARSHWRLDQNEAAFAVMDAYLSGNGAGIERS